MIVTRRYATQTALSVLQIQKGSSTSWVGFITVSPRYHNENPQNGEAVPLRHGLRHVGVQLRVVVHHVQLEGGDTEGRRRGAESVGLRIVLFFLSCFLQSG